MGIKSRSRQSRRVLAMSAAAVTLLLAGAVTMAAQASSSSVNVSNVSNVSATPSAATPAVTGPVTGGLGVPQLQATTFPLSQVGYQQSEYFLSGTATSYVSAAPLGSTGQWQVTPASTSPYTTRIVVDRPADPAKFNGTVVVEWLNDTAGIDTAPEFGYAHNELIRDGFAWIGVSAQQPGVNALKQLDSVRYASLSHPGDSYSYDIFSQAGQAIRADSAKILGGLQPRKLLADGESQSAFRLTTYIDAVQPLAHEYDGFLVHSRGGSGAPLSQAPQASVLAPTPLLFRPDLGVPVLAAETESDVLMPVFAAFPGSGPYLAAQQADSAGFRLWEMAGTAHIDDYGNLSPGDTGNGATDVQEFNHMLNPPSSIGGFLTCSLPINTGEQHYVMDDAEFALNQWVTTGIPPATAPRLQVNAAGTGYVLDANGNAKGGVRTPAVQVPVATLAGLGNGAATAQGAFFCSLVGTTTPFSAAKLAALYPAHGVFVAQWAAATGVDVAAGFIRPADAAQLVAAANGSTVGG